MTLFYLGCEMPARNGIGVAGRGMAEWFGREWFRQSARSGICMLALLAFGCKDAQTGLPQSGAAPGNTGSESKPKPAPVVASGKTTSTGKKEEPAAAPPKADAGRLLDQAELHLKQGKLDQAQQVLTEVRALAGQLAAADTERLSRLEADREDQRKLQIDQARAKSLTLASDLLEKGQLEAATQSLDDVAKAFPTEDERQRIAALKSKIEEHRRRRREFGIAMKLLGSIKPEDVRSARSRLAQDPEVAIPLLVESAQGKNQTLAVNALESLRSMNEPARVVPALVGVLANDAQAELWPVAAAELQKIAAPGAGEPLLKLALSSTSGPQRVAALSALAAVVDPPPQTVIALLPLVYQEGPELSAALAAIERAVIVHRQFDLLGRRNLDMDLTPEQEQQLNGLGTRLAAISAQPATPNGAPPAAPADPSRPAGTNPAAMAAQTLGVLTRLVVPQPLTDVKVLRATAEMPESLATAALDGVWNSVDPKTMWRHPVEKDKKVTIVLDLGVERTVAGVRIWNENEVNGRHRGWKDVEVYVSNTPASLTVVAKGIVPQAPGAADAADYGCLLSVPCVRGRYVRLECSSQWQPDGIGGVSEIQVLGF